MTIFSFKSLVLMDTKKCYIKTLLLSKKISVELIKLVKC